MTPWRWVPSLYLAQGLPYVVVMTLSVVMFKNLGLGNTEVALYTSWLYLPWVLKPLWSPLVELWGSKRHWIVLMQWLVGALLAALAWSLPAPTFVQYALAWLWLMAFASATHDIAADGFYLLALSSHQQAQFVGVRSAFYRLANIGGQGGLVWLAGLWFESTGNMALAWSRVFGVLATGFALLALYHAWALPLPAQPQATERVGVAGYLAVFRRFFQKPGLGVILGFLLFYRFPEAQLLKLATPFLLDPQAAGGLGLSNQQVGVAYGTVGLSALTAGGVLGGWWISRLGLKAALWPLVACMHAPNLVFVALAWWQPESLLLISAALATEQFGYGLGFAAYLMFMLLVAEGEHPTAHYALCTGFMALGMMLPGMWSGWLQAQLGYLGFFAWVLLATVPSLAFTAMIRIPDGYGLKQETC